MSLLDLGEMWRKAFEEASTLFVLPKETPFHVRLKNPISCKISYSWS